MAKKVQVKATQILNHNQVIANSKQLLKEFSKKENFGKTYEIVFCEPDKSNKNIFIGNYTVQELGIVPPTPVPNKNPIVEAGDDVTVIQGATVTLDGKASDDGTITSAEWLEPDGILPTEVNEQELSEKVVMPMLDPDETFRILVFTLVVEDDKGARSEDKTTITVVRDVVKPPVPPIPPVGNELYNSNTIGRWLEQRSFTDFDPLFPKPFVGKSGIILAASGSGKATVDKGIFTLQSGTAGKMTHRRWYLDVPNYSTYSIYGLMFLAENARNHTFQDQSRHNMGGEFWNKFGGFNHLVDLENQKCGLSIELWHDAPKHIEGGKDVDLPKKLSVGQWLFCKHTDQIELKETQDGLERIVHSKSEYDYLDGNGYQLGTKFDYDLSAKDYDFIFNEPLYRQGSSIWFRNNPDGVTQGFSVKDLQVFQLPVIKV